MVISTGILPHSAVFSRPLARLSRPGRPRHHCSTPPVIEKGMHALHSGSKHSLNYDTLLVPLRIAFWVGVIIDHYSRRIMGVAVYKSQPTSEAIRAFLGRTIAKSKKTPRHIVCDRGKQFDCDGFRKWCRKKGIKRPRYGAIGRSGSIAVVERVILTTKTIISRLLLVPYRREAFMRELTAAAEWYNEHRAHSGLRGQTPNEHYHGRFPANRRPRFEPRSRWPRGSPCSRPWALVRGSPGAKLTLEVSFQASRKHLPIVTLKRAA